MTAPSAVGAQDASTAGHLAIPCHRPSFRRPSRSRHGHAGKGVRSSCGRSARLATWQGRALCGPGLVAGGIRQDRRSNDPTAPPPISDRPAPAISDEFHGSLLATWRDKSPPAKSVPIHRHVADGSGSVTPDGQPAGSKAAPPGKQGNARGAVPRRRDGDEGPSAGRITRLSRRS